MTSRRSVLATLWFSDGLLCNQTGGYWTQQNLIFSTVLCLADFIASAFPKCETREYLALSGSHYAALLRDDEMKQLVNG